MNASRLLGPLDACHVELPLSAARIPAGFPSPALDHMQRKLSLDALLELQTPHTYVAQVCGDSMTGIGIFDGDYLIVSRALNARSGDVVVACLNGEVCVKRLITESKRIVLHSENPRYAPLPVHEGDELTIWGVVTHSLRNHRGHA